MSDVIVHWSALLTSMYAPMVWRNDSQAMFEIGRVLVKDGTSMYNAPIRRTTNSDREVFRFSIDLSDWGRRDFHSIHRWTTAKTRLMDEKDRPEKEKKCEWNRAEVLRRTYQRRFRWIRLIFNHQNFRWMTRTVKKRFVLAITTDKNDEKADEKDQ